jgi:multidrug resistance efflux pump
MATDRPPSDPRKLDEYEKAQAAAARTQADTERAKAEAEQALKNRQTIHEEGVKRNAIAKARRQKDREAVKAAQDKARADYLALPLTQDETAELERMEEMCRGRGPYEPTMMRRLADLRVKSKIKAKAKK